MVPAHATEETEDVLEKPPKLELADIFEEFGTRYRKDHNIPLIHHKLMRAITSCRTSRLGGHMKKCDACGYTHPTYNSCGNRHCPKCQSLAKFSWVKKRKEELLPVAYFHNVFTLPHPCACRLHVRGLFRCCREFGIAIEKIEAIFCFFPRNNPRFSGSAILAVGRSGRSL